MPNLAASEIESNQKDIKKKNFTIVYMGSPDFAVEPLKSLLNQGYNIPLVVSQPDKPKGRKGVLSPTPVKEFALSWGLPVITPKTINDPEVMAVIQNCQPDLLVVTAFGQILKEPLLKLAPKGAVNIHASLLPAYRGAAPIHHAIINGETETGITTMFMDVGLDTGDMILQQATPILPEDTTGILRERLAKIGADLILETVDLIASDLVPRDPQIHEKSTYAHKITIETEKINWQASAVDIHNLIRGLVPDTSGFTYYQDINSKVDSQKTNQRLMKIWQTQLVATPNSGLPAGTVVGYDKQGLLVQTGAGILKLIQIQPAGKGKMQAVDWWRGQAKNYAEQKLVFIAS